MVAPRQGNIKRKNGKPGNNIRRFKPGQAGFKPQQHQQQLQRNNRNGLRNAAAIFNQNQIIDNTNQMMDNPGYMDFNEPTVRQPPMQKPNMNKNQQNGIKLNGNGPANGGPHRHANGNKNRRQGPINGGNQHQPQRNGFGNPGNSGRFGPPRNFNGGGGGGGGGGAGFRGGPPRMHPMPPMHDFPPQFFPHQRFGPPMMPPPPPMGMGMMGPPLPPRRPMGPRRGPLPPPMAGAPPFRGNNNGPTRPVRRGKVNGPVNGPNNRRQNLKLGKGRKKADRTKNTKKVNQQSSNQYPLKKPWVTDEIREAHDKKVELANGLKGKKDDALFAEFKAQRDKFVSLYEAARASHIGKNKDEVT